VATSSKRQGLESLDIEEESRLRRIETLLDGLTAADQGGGGDGNTRRSSAVPGVTGLRVSGKTPGAVTLSWNPVRISNFRKYELQIAEDLAFTVNQQSFDLAALTKQISTVSATGGGGNTGLFAKIRAFNSSGNVSNFSQVLDTTTGQAQSGDIADSAVTNPKVDESVTQQLSLRGHIAGFRYSQSATDPDNTIDVATGSCRNAANSGSIVLNTATSKDISAQWAAGPEAGGFPQDQISIAGDTWYRVFVIGKSDESAAEVGFDTDESATNLIASVVLVAGATWSGATYRQIGWVYYRAAHTGGIQDFYVSPYDPERIEFHVASQTVTLAEGNGYTDYNVSGAPPDCNMIYSTWIYLQDHGDQDHLYFFIRPHAIPKSIPSRETHTFRVREQNETDMGFNFPNLEVELDENQSFWGRMRRDAGTYDSRHTFQLFIQGFTYTRGRNI